MSRRTPSPQTQQRRDELRSRRQQGVVEMAASLAATEGHSAVTMQRIAAELECGIASVYRLFPSRDALMAELLHQALDTLYASWLLGLSHLEESLDGRDLDGQARALTVAVGATWFWVVAEDTNPVEIDLSRRLFVDRDIVIPDDQAVHIMPAALRLLHQGSLVLDGAVDAGAIDPGNSLERAIRLIASVTGVVLTAKFGRWDESIFDGHRLAAMSIEDNFAGWGAARSSIDVAFRIVDEETAAGRLAPLLDRNTTG